MAIKNTGTRMVVMMGVMMLLSTTAVVQAESIDIRSEVADIVNLHNDARRVVGSSNMMELGWDERLAHNAATFASLCVYSRPSKFEYDVGSNLFAEGDFVHGKDSIHKFVTRGVESWVNNKKYYTYGQTCDRACAYVQMIHSETKSIGCALQTCDRLNAGHSEKIHASLLVCFYSPRYTNGQYPVQLGYPCSHCTDGTFCKDGLCAQSGSSPIPAYLQLPDDIENGGRFNQTQVHKDALEDSENIYIRLVTNNVRKAYNLPDLEWDDLLQTWADWIVHCNVDYPGPRNSYTNFHRLKQGEQPYDVVNQWRLEGDITHLMLEHGCRTPDDREKCNHFTIIRQAGLTSMACAAKDCRDNTRQLTCIYDNKNIRFNSRRYNYRPPQDYREEYEAPYNYAQLRSPEQLSSYPRTQREAPNDAVLKKLIHLMKANNCTVDFDLEELKASATADDDNVDDVDDAVPTTTSSYLKWWYN